MSLLIDVDVKGRILLRPIVLKLLPELSGLTEQEALVIILVYDNYSPFRQLTERDRIGRAILHVYNDNNPKLLAALENRDKDVHHRISVAVRAYKNLQRDPKRDLLITYQETVDTIQQSIHSGLSDKEIETKLKSISLLRKDIQAIEKEVIEEMIDQGKLEGDKALSFLEQMMSDPKHYQAIITPKEKDKKRKNVST